MRININPTRFLYLNLKVYVGVGVGVEYCAYQVFSPFLPSKTRFGDRPSFGSLELSAVRICKTATPGTRVVAIATRQNETTSTRAGRSVSGLSAPTSRRCPAPHTTVPYSNPDASLPHPLPPPAPRPRPARLARSASSAAGAAVSQRSGPGGLPWPRQSRWRPAGAWPTT